MGITKKKQNNLKQHYNVQQHNQGCSARYGDPCRAGSSVGERGHDQWPH